MRTLKTVLALAAGLALALPLIADVSSDATTKTASTTPSTHHHHHKSAVKREPPDPATETMMKQSDCFTCHSVNAKVIGPAYKDVAKKYRNVPGAEETLVAKVRAGGSGNWGAVPMVAHPQLSDAQLHAMVKWVLAH
ncbi:MAG TPA: c-type cytochrome [bacterium]|jgi:cytochrome c|nr:c-type cytochrome [bacterium]